MDRREGVPAFTIRQLAVFVAVAETGTVSAAAERLHLSPSAVSAALNELERTLRVDLLHRQRAKGAELTPTGQLLLPRARLLIHEAAELQADAWGENGDEGVSGHVRLACYPSLAPTVVPGLVSSFLDRHPRASIDLLEATQDRLMDAFATGRLDLALMYDVSLDPSLRTALVTTFRPSVILPAGHRLAAAGGPIDLAELSEEPMILLDAPPSADHQIAACGQAGFTPRIGYRVTGYETSRSFVGRGLGWAFQLQRPHTGFSYEGRPIVSVEVASPALTPVAVVIAAPRDTLLSRVARAFVAHAIAHGERDADGSETNT